MIRLSVVDHGHAPEQAAFLQAARVQLDQNELNAHPLRIGLSMQAEVQTRDESGAQLGAAVGTSYRTDVFAQYGANADAEIARIIAQNMPIERSGHRG